MYHYFGAQVNNLPIFPQSKQDLETTTQLGFDTLFQLKPQAFEALEDKDTTLP